MKTAICKEPDALLSMAFGLLLLTLLANLLFASTPLPLGGPNVILAAASVLVLSICILMNGHRVDDWSCIATILAAFTLMVWAALVHLFTDTLGYVRIGQTAMGIGVLCVTCMATTTPGRASLIMQVTVLATLLSALFGFGVIYAWDIFFPLWNAIADVHPRQVRDITAGRLAGMTNGQGIMASHIAVAVPFVLAMWIHGQRLGRMRNAAWNLALLLLLLFLFWAALATGYRSLVPALFVGAIAVFFTSMFVSPELKPLIFRKLCVIALATAIGTALLVTSGSDTYEHRGTPTLIRVWTVPLPESASCIESLGVLSESMSVSGIWSGDCESGRNPGQYARYYTLILERETPLTIHVNSSASEMFWSLLRDSGPEGEERNPPPQRKGSGEAGRTGVEVPAGQYTIKVATDGSGAGERFRLRILLTLEPDGVVNIRSRYARLTDRSVQHRLYMFSVAWRYFLDHPLGAGGFFPSERHLDPHWGPRLRRDFMKKELHNHFLLVLTHYGLPGLLLLVLFCSGILWSVVRSVRLARRAPDVPGTWLLSAVVGALTVYWLFNLTDPVGPFYTDWHHFILVGLTLGMPRILSLRSRKSAT